MSSATSTKQDARLKPRATAEPRGPAEPRAAAEPGAAPEADAGLQPWQFFVLAGLGSATAVVFVARGRGLTALILLSLLMAATALVGLAALRALRPLVTPEEDRTTMFGHRTREALEREKMLALRSIKELEFDRAMGKVSETDWREMSGRLRARAARLMRQLDAGAGYREQVERDLASRLERTPGPKDSADVPSASGDVRGAGPADAPAVTRTCASCAAANDADARFCKSCGQKL